jgi:hypothetical protein
MMKRRDSNEKRFDNEDNHIASLLAHDRYQRADAVVKDLMVRIYKVEIHIKTKHCRRQDSWERAGARDDERDIH